MRPSRSPCTNWQDRATEELFVAAACSCHRVFCSLRQLEGSSKSQSQARHGSPTRVGVPVDATKAEHGVRRRVKSGQMRDFFRRFSANVVCAALPATKASRLHNRLVTLLLISTFTNHKGCRLLLAGYHGVGAAGQPSQVFFTVVLVCHIFKQDRRYEHVPLEVAKADSCRTKLLATILLTYKFQIECSPAT